MPKQNVVHNNPSTINSHFNPYSQGKRMNGPLHGSQKGEISSGRKRDGSLFSSERSLQKGETLTGSTLGHHQANTNVGNSTSKATTIS
jgi:hypothetical protein